MERAKKRIAIIGSGLSGLVAAYEVKKAILRDKLPFELIVIERHSASGGMIKTLQTEDGPIDVGASSFDLRRKDVRPFLREIGLGDQIQYNIGEKPDRFSNYGFIQNEKPTYHGLPLKIQDILYDKELSTGDKIKVLYNFNFSRQRLPESFATTRDFLDNRFCREVSNLVAYPYYPENIYGSMELCPPAIFDPQLVRLFGKEKQPYLENQQDYVDGEGKEYTLVGGMSTLVERLLDFVGEHVETDQNLANVSRMDDGILLLSLNKKEELRVGSLISAVPVSELAGVVNDNPQVANLLPKTMNAGMGTILFQFPKNVITRYPRGYGFVIPKRSAFHITKGTFLNRKWPSFANAKYDNLLIEIGRRQEDTIIRLPDEAILSIVEEELKDILGLKGHYKSARVYRWHQAVPHLSLEAREEMSKNEEKFESLFKGNGVFIGGNGLQGYGMHNAVHEGIKLAQQAIDYMKKRNQL